MMNGKQSPEGATKGTILVTGGAGFIGSHTCVELLDAGYGVVIIDNLVNSKAESVRRVEQITGKQVGDAAVATITQLVDGRFRFDRET